MTFFSVNSPFKAVLFAFTALCAFSNAAFAEPVRVIMATTEGDIVLELDEDRAPKTVENFLQYADEGFYNDTLFHRVIEGFMIQGGGFSTNYQRKTTRPPISNEAYNGLRNDRYTIAMARTNAPHSATAQFFINSQDNRNLDHSGTTQRGWGYTVFGKVVDGTAVVDTISRARTGAGGPFSRDVPVKPVVILSVARASATTAGAAQAANASASSPDSAMPAITDVNSANGERSNSAPVQPVEQN